MSSYPLKVWKTFRREQSEAPNSEEYQPLANDPSAPEPERTGADQQMPKPETRKGDLLAEWAAYVSTTIFLTTTWLMALNSSPSTPFTYHPIFQSLGVSSFAYGILTLQPTSRPRSKAEGLARHQLAMGFGLLCIILGTSAIVANKNINYSDHFVSAHAKLGLSSFVWILFQVIVGVGSVWFDGKLFGGGTKAKSIWKYHRLSGYILFPLLILTSSFGGWSQWAMNHSLFSTRIIAYTLSPFILLISVLFRIRPSKMRFFTTFDSFS
ncbi:hypothetical protein BJ322DRAFT_1102980 [Thelephora terrestris]|uniref:Cytochrome b561 domain-containing protein n=1 Tax=Thelephora terrestris TaxID=56493 RepID=A0A9P6HRA5_9AGAM|nr:hypothetical protein BJ322DRAFT_1102980 [Thelephora terrestris]